MLERQDVVVFLVQYPGIVHADESEVCEEVFFPLVLFVNLVFFGGDSDCFVVVDVDGKFALFKFMLFLFLSGDVEEVAFVEDVLWFVGGVIEE